MKRDDVGVSRERLVNGRLEDQGQHWSLNTHICYPYLEQLRCEGLLVEVRFRQHLDSIFAAVLRRLATRRSVVEVHATDSGMTIVGRLRARQNFAHKVHNSVTAGTELSNNLKLPRRFVAVNPGLGWAYRDPEDDLTLEKETLSDQVAL